MAVLIEQKDGSGKVIGRCDSRCYNATGTHYDCICGGKNHGVGLEQALKNADDATETEEKTSANVPLFAQAIGAQEGVIKGIYSTRHVFIDRRKLLPYRSRGIRNHSPDGFAWGYGGSGPAQLALAVLLEFTDRDTAVSLYQQFKWEVIANLPQTNFILEMEKVTEWLNSHKEAKGDEI